jgi:hypothetical protein
MVSLVLSIISSVVALASVLVAVIALGHARRSADAAEKSAAATVTASAATAVAAEAANSATKIELQRRHAELRPRFRVTCERLNPGGEQLRLVVELTGPPDLERLDDLIVTIRDDRFSRLKPTSSLDTPSAQKLPDHVWGPVRFVPGTGPGVTTRPGAKGADAAGRETRSAGMPVGETRVYALEPNPAPPGASWTPDDWRAEVGTDLRLRIEGRRDRWEPWMGVGVIDASGDLAAVELP